MFPIIFTMHSAIKTSIACALFTWTLQINLSLGVSGCLFTYFQILTKQVSNRGLLDHKVTLGYFLIYFLWYRDISMWEIPISWHAFLFLFFFNSKVDTWICQTCLEKVPYFLTQLPPVQNFRALIWHVYPLNTNLLSQPAPMGVPWWRWHRCVDCAVASLLAMWFSRFPFQACNLADLFEDEERVSRWLMKWWLWHCIHCGLCGFGSV